MAAAAVRDGTRRRRGAAQEAAEAPAAKRRSADRQVEARAADNGLVVVKLDPKQQARAPALLPAGLRALLGGAAAGQASPLTLFKAAPSAEEEEEEEEQEEQEEQEQEQEQEEEVERDDRASSLLARFIFPIPPNRFFEEFFGRVPLALLTRRSGALKRLRAALLGLDLARLVEATASDSVHVWMRPLGSDAASGGLSSFELEDAEAALKCYEAGASLYFRAPRRVERRLVQSMSAALGHSFAARYANGDLRGEVEMFASRRGHVTDWHFDYMNNFTVQLSGRKRWRLTPSAIAHPLRGATPHYRGIDTAELQLKLHQQASVDAQLSPTDAELERQRQVELCPGDVLYHPPGVWHRVECTEDSLSLNISLMPASNADVLCDAVRQVALRDPTLRAPFRAETSALARVQMRDLLARLRDAVASLSPEQVLPDSLFEPPCTLTVSSSSPRETAPPLGRDARFRVNQLMSLVAPWNAEQREARRFVLHGLFSGEDFGSTMRHVIVASDDAAAEALETLARARGEWTPPADTPAWRSAVAALRAAGYLIHV